MKRTIRARVGRGSVNHNTRKFHAKNTDPERSHLNITYCEENIKAVYHELFDEALARYNSKQTRADRKIKDYYEKIRASKQEKTFHEIILQVGNKDDMHTGSDEGELAKIVSGIIDANPQSVADFKAGKDKAIGFIVGQTMRATKGKGNPQVINKLIREELLKR